MVARVTPGRIADRLLGFCFPRRCPGCDRGHERAGLFCAACERLMQALETAAECRRCGRPVAMPDAPCALCRGRGLPPFGRTLSLGVFREPLRSALHGVKYAGRWHLAEALADRLVDAHDLQSWLCDADALVPVPLHRRRQAARGFNQADVIARQIGKRCGVPVITPVARTRDTPTQTELHALAQRAKNLRGAFAVTDAAAVRGRRLVVVDDVSTTGATLASLGRTLRGARAAEMSAVVLCVADPKGRDFAYI
jgi:ComF family protein